MKGRVLVTDTLFIFDEHVKQLENAGYEVVRVEKPDMSEAELIEAIKGKAGYILGGIEHVTQGVLDAADELKAISLVGTGYKWFIPAWEYALEKGIAISNTPNGPANEVAEWAITACLMMNRNFLELGLVGKEKFAVTKGIESQKVGIIGIGHIGQRIAEMLKVFKPSKVSYYSQHRHEDKEAALGIEFNELEKLLQESDIVFVCVSDEAKGLLDLAKLSLMKKNALLVNITHPGIIVENDLFEVLDKKHIRAISDYPMSAKFNDLPFSNWYSMNSSNTITQAGSKLMSDMATSSLLNLLETGKDENQVLQP